MGSRRVHWAENLPDGTPLLIGGAIADVDEATNRVTLGERAQEVIREVLAREPRPTEVFLVPGIDLAHEVYQLVQAKHRAGVSIHDPLPKEPVEDSDVKDADTSSEEFVDAQTQEVIDQALQRVHSQSFRYQRFLGRRPAVVSMTELRRSPIGTDLLFLGRVANGEEHTDLQQVFQKVDAILELLFRLPGEDQYLVPRSFWEEPLGKLLSQAKLHTVDASELMTIGNAASQLGVSRPTMYRWMEDGTLDSFHDAANGRVYVRRQSIEAMQETERAQNHLSQSVPT